MSATMAMTYEESLRSRQSLSEMFTEAVSKTDNMEQQYSVTNCVSRIEEMSKHMEQVLDSQEEEGMQGRAPAEVRAFGYRPLLLELMKQSFEGDLETSTKECLARSNKQSLIQRETILMAPESKSDEHLDEQFLLQRRKTFAGVIPLERRRVSSVHSCRSSTIGWSSIELNGKEHHGGLGRRHSAEARLLLDAERRLSTDIARVFDKTEYRSRASTGAGPSPLVERLVKSVAAKQPLGSDTLIPEKQKRRGRSAAGVEIPGKSNTSPTPSETANKQRNDQVTL